MAFLWLSTCGLGVDVVMLVECFVRTFEPQKTAASDTTLSYEPLSYSPATFVLEKAIFSGANMYATRALGMRASRPLFRPLPKEDQSAHTISQRLRTLKKIPPELLPLGAVLCVAVGAAIYSCGKKFMTDKTLRLTRSKPEDHA
ncbi:hypothetical protein LOZ65_003138 [Ophidiomyces ophidiicola]|nr:hypothetical protein LOZ65_003138 [Ophidiomyces ophidiicola]